MCYMYMYFNLYSDYFNLKMKCYYVYVVCKFKIYFIVLRFGFVVNYFIDIGGKLFCFLN